MLSANRLVGAIERSQSWDRWSTRIRTLVRPVVGRGRRRDLATGAWLGHPLHPVVVVVPLGCWIAAGILDVFGGPGSNRAARKLVGAGVVSVIPASVSGAADWLDTSGAEQRVGAAHAVANNVATLAFATSWLLRGRHRLGAGRALSAFGTAMVGVAGYLGGHLAYTRGVGVNTTAFQSGPEEWTPVASLDDLGDDDVSAVRLGDLDLCVISGDAPAVLEDRCTHRGGPLSEGALDGECIVCPWHGSRFSVRDGAVRSGPASIPQPVYETRVADGVLEVRRSEHGGLRTNPVGARSHGTDG